VTTSQRARLILSFGVLNIVLATIALGIGGVELQQRARASGGPSQIAVVPIASPTGAGTPSAETTQSPPAGETSSQAPSVAPSGPAQTPTPSVTPSATLVSPGATSGLAVTPAVASPAAPANPTAEATPAPTPRPTAKSTPAPTPRATPKPTAKPTPKPTVAAGGNAKARPPCPDKGGSPPGHAKTNDPHKACGKGKDKGSGGKNGGIVLILPLLASSVAWAVRPERLRPRRRAR
jgi:hypothetical protein